MSEKAEEGKERKSYRFDEAIDLTGTGCYNIGLLATLSLTLLYMGIDLFSFSAIVPLVTCDFNLDVAQKSILVTVPFLGPVFTAYIWGFVSDTQGRRMTLIFGMTVSFIMSTLCVFSPNWIALAVFKFISTCFSSCAQAASFTLLGESCPELIKGKYLIIMSSFLHLGLAIYFTASYLLGNLNFSYDLGLITFVPWRLLTLVLTLPGGICAVLLTFFYESPKFLVNAGYEDQAVDVLRRIHRRNCGSSEVYPVEKLILDEGGNVTKKDDRLLQSLLEQTIPLFKPPLLYRTLLMFYLILIVYSISSLYIWLPFLAHAFTKVSDGDFSQGLCSMISNNNIINTTVTDECHAVELPMLVVALVSASSYSLLNMIMSKLASRKRILMMIILAAAGISSFLTTVIPHWTAGFAYFGALSASLCMGPVFAYYVDLYPTSFRGMASCLGVMVARISSVAGINIVGPFITTHCSYTFYGFGAFFFSGVLASLLLPPDRPKNTQ